jgi:hypothetical protein
VLTGPSYPPAGRRGGPHTHTPTRTRLPIAAPPGILRSNRSASFLAFFTPRRPRSAVGSSRPGAAPLPGCSGPPPAAGSTPRAPPYVGAQAPSGVAGAPLLLDRLRQGVRGSALCTTHNRDTRDHVHVRAHIRGPAVSHLPCPQQRERQQRP